MAGWTDEYPARSGDPFPHRPAGGGGAGPRRRRGRSCRGRCSCRVLAASVIRWRGVTVAAMACPVAIVPHHVTAGRARSDVPPDSSRPRVSWPRYTDRMVNEPAARACGDQRAWLRADVIAGVTVAAYLVPQAMAYAQLAGLPAVAGLWAVLGPLAVYAALGTSRLLSAGPESDDRADDGDDRSGRRPRGTQAGTWSRGSAGSPRRRDLPGRLAGPARFPRRSPLQPGTDRLHGRHRRHHDRRPARAVDRRSGVGRQPGRRNSSRRFDRSGRGIRQRSCSSLAVLTCPGRLARWMPATAWSAADDGASGNHRCRDRTGRPGSGSDRHRALRTACPVVPAVSRAPICGRWSSPLSASRSSATPTPC